jgi:hypothetical protein
MKISKLQQFPVNSNIAKDFGNINYCDSYQITFPTKQSAEQIASKIFKLPKWGAILMKIRDLAVGIFGLKTEKDAPDNLELFFPVIEKTPDEVVMELEDKHLNFRVSILIDRANSYIYITTLVHYNNCFGTLYFAIIKPFHRIMVKASIKNGMKSEIEN